MNRICTALLLLALYGCGSGGDGGTNGSTADAAAAENVELARTRFVDELPTYDSEPLPEGLVWETNTDDPIFASPEAKRGGTFRTWMQSFPLTLRTVGPDSNGAFAGYLRGMVSMGLVGVHPNTLEYIPALATHWAFDPDGRTVYYRLDPSARWSDGEPITADDYLFTLDFMRSPHIVAPWYNNYYTNIIVDVRKHDDHTISIVGATPKAKEELLLEYGMAPTPRHFHKLDENWVRDYDWRAAPGPGPYRVARVEKGQFVELERIADWWGDGNKYMQHRFNPDRVRITVIRDMNVAWEYFMRGEIDAFPVMMPNFWYEKAQGPQFDRGYIAKIKFYTDTPQPSMGMWLNTADPILADHDVRLGLAYAMNVDLMLTSLLRGDYERLRQHYDGYWDYTNPNIEPRPFDLQKADEHLNAAGWTTRGRDGIRVKDGRRLSLSVIYQSQEHTPRLVLLREEARKAGVELNLQLMDGSAAFKQILEKKHQIAWMAWATGIIPAFWEHYHSENANKPQTNNITNTADPELDELIMEFERSTDKAARVELAHRIQQIVHDMAVFIPMYKVPYTREAFWRWLKLPPHYGTRTTELLFDPISSSSESTFWIDEAAREETLEAMRTGRAFEPINIEDTTWRVE